MSQAVLRIAPKGQLFQVTGRHGVAETCERERIRSESERVGGAGKQSSDWPERATVDAFTDSIDVIQRSLDYPPIGADLFFQGTCDVLSVRRHPHRTQHASGNTSGTAS